MASLVLVASACLPAVPSVGRGTPVRKVALIGDSISWGLFGTSPWVRDELAWRLGLRGIGLSLDGGPAETPAEPFLTTVAWVDRLAARVADEDPDVVIIQAMLFPSSGDPARQDQYRAAFTGLVDVAASRGAHVYLVINRQPPAARAEERINLAVAQQIQLEVIAGRGIATIPIDRELAGCAKPTLKDGWHLSAAGQRCYADGLTAAVDQLREITG